MKNKIELKKMLLFCLITILLFKILISLFNYYQYRTYTANFNYKLNEIIGKLNEKYPELEKRELIEILNSSERSFKEQLKPYGVDIEKESYILQNDVFYKKYALIEILIVILFAVILMIIFLKYNYSKDKK